MNSFEIKLIVEVSDKSLDFEDILHAIENAIGQITHFHNPEVKYIIKTEQN